MTEFVRPFIDAYIYRDFYSYMPLLCKYLRLIEPKTIFEWGTGESTKIMMQLCPNAEIWTVEDDPEFYKLWKGLETKKVHVYNVPLNQGYTDFPLLINRKFDLIFIDGVDAYRPECLRVAREVVSERGAIVLHDSDRTWYSSAIALFTTLEESDRTIVLKK